MKYFIETFGCQMNKSDSDLMELSLENEGFIKTNTLEKADIAVFNTCSVRKHAEDRATAKIREAKSHLKKRNGVVVVSGCMAQRIGESFIENKYADIAIGPFSNPKIGKIVKDFLNGNKDNIFISQNKENFSERLDNGLLNRKEVHPWHKWITITHGCENFCTYCIVPYVRGPLISFSSDKILNYIQRSADNGIIEISLLGQNVNQYGQDNNDIPFYELLNKCAEINGIEKINFITSHPKDFTTELADVIFSHDNISKSIHLPLQSGSNNILKKMNRQYNFEHYQNIVNYIKNKNIPVGFSTDLIVGFPGESEKDFKDTIKAVKEFQYDEAFMYAYSPRVGTSAADSDNQVSEDIKKQRLTELINTQRLITENNLKKTIGTTENIIVESVSKRSDNEVIGKSWLNHSILIKGNYKDIGNIVKVKISGLRGATLTGEII